MDVQNIQEVLDNISYGLYIVTSFSNDRLNGQISNTVIQITAEPPGVAVAINKNELTHEFILQSKVFGVCVLNQNASMDLIALFGYKSGRDVDKFKELEYEVWDTGVPIITRDVVCAFEVKVKNTLDVGTHTIFAGEVVNAKMLDKGEPLTYKFFKEVKKGRASKNAPTYRKSVKPSTSTEERNNSMEKYVCKICGYVYDPEKGDPENNIDPGIPFDKLPDDWVCPVCGAGKEEFEKTE